MEDFLIHIDVQKTLLSSVGVMTLDIQSNIPVGKLTALFGQSGSGKTTLLRMIAGSVKPDSGNITVENEIWFDSKKGINLPPQKRNVGMMFQDYALFPNMTVEQNIKYAQAGNDKLFVKKLLEKFGLSEFAKRKPGNLSGGQKQRAALARALARKPKILLLDEPLSALDSDMRANLQDEILRIHEISDATTLLVSHDLHEIFRLASNVECISNGRIIKKGNPSDVFSDNSISGKYNAIGNIVGIEKHDVVNIVTVVSGNKIVKVIALDDDISQLCEGDLIQISAKAFNPIIRKLL